MKSARVVFRVARGVEARVSQGTCRLFGSCPLRCKNKLHAAKPWLVQGFSHFWPMNLAFCRAHAGSVHGACGLTFRVAHPNSSRFSSCAGSPKHWGFASSRFKPIHRVAAEVFQRTARRIEVCRWSEFQSALPGMTIQDRLGKVHP